MQDTFGDSVAKLIGYARVSTKAQDTDRHVQDLLAAGVRRDDLYIDHGVNGARAARPGFNRALEALQEDDTLVITTLDRLGRSTVNMLGLSEELKARAVNLQVLNLGGGCGYRHPDGLYGLHGQGCAGADGTGDQT